jgi:hypothetical protein
MSEKELLENYLANLDKALGLVDNTDDLSFKTSWVSHKLDIYNRISKLMDLIEEDIEKGEK